MVTTLILAATIASQCVHHKAPRHLHSKRPEPQCESVLPYPNWQPRDNEDSLSQDSMLEPLSIGPLTRYVTITQTEPCHVYSATLSGWGWWYELTSAGGGYVPAVRGFRAPELDPTNGVASVTLLALALIIFFDRGERK
jgi:hypothetical protein